MPIAYYHIELSLRYHSTINNAKGGWPASGQRLSNCYKNHQHHTKTKYNTRMLRVVLIQPLSIKVEVRHNYLHLEISHPTQRFSPVQ